MTPPGTVLAALTGDLVDPDAWADPGPALVAVAVVVAIGVAAALSVGEGRGTYTPRLAWRRAVAFFSFCWLASWFTGVLPTLTREPLIRDDQATSTSWWTFAVICLFVIVAAYGIIWPRGTLTYGRPLHVGWALAFGALWGVSQGQLYLSMWSLSERLIGDGVWTVIVTFLAISAFTGVWHDRYWDRLVAPEHNIEEWNLRKVVFCHVPNLVVTLSFLAYGGNAALFVGYQTLALMLSTWFMHFPRPADPIQPAR